MNDFIKKARAYVRQRPALGFVLATLVLLAYLAAGVYGVKWE
ncbi:hypothetical protein [Caldimonas sp. KR1-144]